MSFLYVMQIRERGEFLCTFGCRREGAEVRPRTDVADVKQIGAEVGCRDGHGRAGGGGREEEVVRRFGWREAR